MKYDNLLKFFASIIICELAGVIGSFFTVSQINGWYKNLNKPGFNPPNWIFGPVWTIIFVLMGISLYLVWSKKWHPKNKSIHEKTKMRNQVSISRIPVVQAILVARQKFSSGSWQKLNIVLIFTAQLVLNILWSIIFFGMHSAGLAFFELLMLWFAIIFTSVNFYRVSKIAALLLLPYILWVSFAAVLNLAIFLLN